MRQREPGACCVRQTRAGGPQQKLMAAHGSPPDGSMCLTTFEDLDATNFVE